MRPLLAIIFTVLSTCFFLVDTCNAQIDPRGFYFMRAQNNGQPTSFTEWFTVIPLTGNRYMLRDIFGYGWSGTILPSGQITLDPGQAGNFTDPDHFHHLVPGGLDYVCNRIADTTVDFPVLLPNAPTGGDASYAGDFTTQLRRLNPETGTELLAVEELITLTVNNNELRFTRPNNRFSEGVFISPGRVAFRIVQNQVTGWLAQFASYAGTSSNDPWDIVGELNFTDPDHFKLVLARQNRTSIGSQTQELWIYEGERFIDGGYQKIGDYDQNGRLDIMDATSLLRAAFGGPAPIRPCDGVGLNSGGTLILLDVDGSGAVDMNDPLHLLNYLFMGGPAPSQGIDCIPVPGCLDVCTP